VLATSSSHLRIAIHPNRPLLIGHPPKNRRRDLGRKTILQNNAQIDLVNRTPSSDPHAHAPYRRMTAASRAKDDDVVRGLALKSPWKSPRGGFGDMQQQQQQRRTEVNSLQQPPPRQQRRNEVSNSHQEQKTPSKVNSDDQGVPTVSIVQRNENRPNQTKPPQPPLAHPSSALQNAVRFLHHPS
jgi:hypothetical protein